MNIYLKIALMILLAVYVVSPLDLCPGPVDDAILLLCAVGGGLFGKKAKAASH